MKHKKRSQSKWEIDKVDCISEIIENNLLNQKLAILTSELYSILYQLQNQSQTTIHQQNKNDIPVNSAGETEMYDDGNKNCKTN